MGGGMEAVMRLSSGGGSYTKHHKMYRYILCVCGVCLICACYNE